MDTETKAFVREGEAAALVGLNKRQFRKQVSAGIIVKAPIKGYKCLWFSTRHLLAVKKQLEGGL